MFKHNVRMSLVLDQVIPCFWSVISQSVSVPRRQILPMPTTHKCSKHHFGVSFPNWDVPRISFIGKYSFFHPLPFSSRRDTCPLACDIYRGMLTPRKMQWSANMSDFAPNTKSAVPTTRKSLSTSKALLDTLKTASSVIEENHHIDSASVGIEDVKVDFFAEGGYNYLWLVSFSSKPSGEAVSISTLKVILREPNDDALLPWQIENEVAHLTFIAKNHPSIPVPKVYAYDTGKTGNEPFILMEYIDGQPLSTAWTTYTEDEKWAAARQVARIVVEMSEITSQRIGGLTLTHETGPTVEGIKLFRGRVRHLKVALVW